jgi:hypothetical protein
LVEVTFWVDGRPVATLQSPPYQAFWQLEPGDHEAWGEGTLRDGQKLTSARVTFEVVQEKP